MVSLGEDGSRLTAILASGLLNPFPSLAQLPKLLQAPVECKVVDHGPNRLASVRWSLEGALSGQLQFYW